MPLSQKTLDTLLKPEVAGRIQKTSVLLPTRIIGAVLTHETGTSQLLLCPSEEIISPPYNTGIWQGSSSSKILFSISVAGKAWGFPGGASCRCHSLFCPFQRLETLPSLSMVDEHSVNSLQEGTVLQLAVIALWRQWSAPETRNTCILGQKNATVHLRAFRSVKGHFVSVRRRLSSCNNLILNGVVLKSLGIIFRSLTWMRTLPLDVSLDRDSWFWTQLWPSLDPRAQNAFQLCVC